MRDVTDLGDWTRQKAIELARQRPDDPICRGVADLLQHYEDSPDDYDGLSRIAYRIEAALRDTCDYSVPVTPRGYECGECRAVGVKLWRLYNVFMDRQKLYCVDCVMSKSHRNLQVREDGKFYDEELEVFIDSMGSLVPAVPTKDNKSFWGYTVVPVEGVEWWRGLPLRERSEDDG